jgi:ectoine hydroxylase-related dioxygenase (phytanoyl-CoA dioxygenase family)
MISLEATNHVNQVRQNGFVHIKNAVDPAVVGDLLAFAQSFQYSEEQQANLLRNQQRLNGYGRTIYNVALKKPEALRLFIRNIQGEVIKGLLNDQYYSAIPKDLPNYILRAMLLRSSLDAMPYHIDSFIPYSGNYTSVVQSIIFLNDSKVDNGCTLVVPKSHQTGEYAPQGDNASAIPVEAEAGDIVIWDSRIWHATLENKANRDRWALIATFCRWYIKQGFDYPRSISASQFEHLDDDEKIVLGYCSYTPFDEFDKTEVKGGLNRIFGQIVD